MVMVMVMETAASLPLCHARPKRILMIGSSLPTATVTVTNKLINHRVPINTSISSRYRCLNMSLPSSSLQMMSTTTMRTLKQQQQQQQQHVVGGCVSCAAAAGSSSSSSSSLSSSAAAAAALLAELERELELEEDEEWMRDIRCTCKGSKGMVELLECLETEAIMGDDQGKLPTDYNRRAQLFHKSSRVFQALKAQQPHPQQS